MKVFYELYDIAFPIKEVETKINHLETPCITKGLRKSLKRKNDYMKKFFKKRKLENEKIHQTYKNLVEKIKNIAKKICYQGRLKVCQNDKQKQSPGGVL